LKFHVNDLGPLPLRPDDARAVGVAWECDAAVLALRPLAAPAISITVVWRRIDAASVSLRRVNAKRVGQRQTTSLRRTDTGRVTPRPAPARRELSLAERLLLVLQAPIDVLLQIPGPLEWPAPLYGYQRDGVRALLERTELLLADDMGLGKTIQAIAAIRILTHLRRVGQTLVVVPASLVTQWMHELRLWAPELRVVVVRGNLQDRLPLWEQNAHLHIVSYDTMRNDFVSHGEYGPAARHWDIVVLDEAQKIKNRDTKTSSACRRLPRRRAWALTGTPLENHLGELASVCEFLTSWTNPRQWPRPLISNSAILARHRELQLRRRKDDVLQDLPRKTSNEILLDLTPHQRKTYDKAEREGVVELRKQRQTITVHHVLALIQRLKQICNVCPESGESSKLDDLVDRLEQIAEEGQRALVFSQYVDANFGVKAIAARLSGLDALTHTGQLSLTSRDGIVQQFKSDPRHKALILSLRAGGQGLNLQEASYVVHFDRWWNPAVERQAEDRVHRLGQTRAVTVYKYICSNTIEERIDAVLKRKQDLFDELVDQVSIDPAKLLGEKELFGLFGLEAPERGRKEHA
jgi:SNF2 family DNA or RNA helicase